MGYIPAPFWRKEEDSHCYKYCFESCLDRPDELWCSLAQSNCNCWTLISGWNPLLWVIFLVVLLLIIVCGKIAHEKAAELAEDLQSPTYQSAYRVSLQRGQDPLNPV